MDSKADTAIRSCEELAEWINWTIKNRPEALEATIPERGKVCLQLWGGVIHFHPAMIGGGHGVYSIEDTAD